MKNLLFFAIVAVLSFNVYSSRNLQSNLPNQCSKIASSWCDMERLFRSNGATNFAPQNPTSYTKVNPLSTGFRAGYYAYQHSNGNYLYCLPQSYLNSTNYCQKDPAYWGQNSRSCMAIGASSSDPYLLNSYQYNNSSYCYNSGAQNSNQPYSLNYFSMTLQDASEWTILS